MHDLKRALSYEDALQKAKENCETFDQTAFDVWIRTRPEAEQELAERCPPDKIYHVPIMVKSACVVLGYNKDGFVQIQFLRTGETASTAPDNIIAIGSPMYSKCPKNS
jgi:hypothetical protein